MMGTKGKLGVNTIPVANLVRVYDPSGIRHEVPKNYWHRLPQRHAGASQAPDGGCGGQDWFRDSGVDDLGQEDLVKQRGRAGILGAAASVFCPDGVDTWLHLSGGCQPSGAPHDELSPSKHNSLRQQPRHWYWPLCRVQTSCILTWPRKVCGLQPRSAHTASITAASRR